MDLAFKENILTTAHWSYELSKVYTMKHMSAAVLLTPNLHLYCKSELLRK